MFDDDYERAELKAQDALERKQRYRLRANPDCRDPDHPGCDACMDDEED